MTTTTTEDLRPLYDAACKAKFTSTKDRSFEEWSDQVSEDGLSLARQVLSVQLDRERERLEKEVLEKAKVELAAYEAPPSFGWIAASASARYQLRKAVADLLAFEAKQSK